MDKPFRIINGNTRAAPDFSARVGTEMSGWGVRGAVIDKQMCDPNSNFNIQTAGGKPEYQLSACEHHQ
jgi:hypothetical protein